MAINIQAILSSFLPSRLRVRSSKKSEKTPATTEVQGTQLEALFGEATHTELSHKRPNPEKKDEKKKKTDFKKLLDKV